MVNNQIVIQLLDTNAGYLDVAEDTVVPLNFSVADIRDVTKRTGSFSKTIVLAGTKNNAKMLNHYYDFNAQAGTFDINKKQRCNIVQNGVVVISEAILQLISVKKKQNNMTEDDEVMYEVLVKDSTADFFTEISTKFLADIEIENDGHKYEAADIVASWNHTVNDVYKYVVPYNETSDVPVKTCFPGIYAKYYWDRLHEFAGYTYVWGDLTSDTVRFDKLIVPYNGDIQKLGEEYILDNTCSFGRVASQEFAETSFLTSTSDWQNFIQYTIENDQEFSDPNNEYDPTTWTFTSSKPVFAPDKLVVEVTADFDYIFRNNESVNIAAGIIALSGTDVDIEVLGAVRNHTSTSLTPFYFKWDTVTAGVSITNGGALNDVPNGRLIVVNGTTYAPGDTVIASGQGTFTVEITNFSQADPLRFGLFNRAYPNNFRKSGGGVVNAQSIFRLNNITVNMKPSVENGLIIGSVVDLNLFIPRNVKQSDFVKSICTMYNLYVEQDPTNQYRLIYKRRDEFYDDGRTLDWTSKLDRSQEQEIIFLPELSNKKLRLTYRYDQSDSASKAYFEEVKEVYGQIENTFSNEFVKGTDIKELIFAPTFNLNTPFGQNVPRFGDDKFSPSTTIRILYDGGNLQCQPWILKDYPISNTNQNLNTYPYFGHFDRPNTPLFDINFGVCDYYLYQLTSITNNNLYYNNWLRTISNIENGKLVTAYFWLTEADINLLRLSDKIRIDNGYYYINKIVDYNAASYQLTKVELITVEQELGLGLSTPGEFKPYDVKDVVVNLLSGGGAILSGRDLKDVKKAQNASALGGNRSSSVISNALNGYIILGRDNQLTEGFSGVIIGNNGIATEPGYYVGDTRITSAGVEFIGQLIIDGGIDQVMNLNKRSEADFLDAGEDTVRKWGGISNARPFIDGGQIN